MQCPHYTLCRRLYELHNHPGGGTFAILERLGTCTSLEYCQCIYLFKLYNPHIPVLLVEDEDAIRENLFHMLHDIYSQSFALYPAATYLQASQLIGQKFFPLAFLDIKLPDGSGMQLLQDMRSENMLTTVILITAFDKYEELIDRAYEHGARECIGKPFSYEQIRTVLDKYIPPIEAQYGCLPPTT